MPRAEDATPNPNDAILRPLPNQRIAKNPEDWGGDYDKIREEMMSRGSGGFISNTVGQCTLNSVAP